MLRLLSLSSRTVALLIAPEGTRFHLADPVEWTLQGLSGAALRTGVARVAPLFLEGLEPDTPYVLDTPLGRMHFRTRACAGLVDIRDFGADPKAPDNAAAIQRAVAATPKGGTLLIPEGRFVSRPIFFKPAITVWLPQSAELAATSTRDGWPVLAAHDDGGRVTGTWEGLPEASFAALVSGLDCHGLHLTGSGVVDGGGDRGDWWTWPKETRQGARRPRTIGLLHSRDVVMSGLTVRNSPSWTIHPYRCDGFTAAALHIQNPPDSPNTDGLNPESSCDVTLTGVVFSVGDDCIAVKAGKRGKGQVDHLSPTRNLSVTHCHMERGHGAVVLGSEMSGEITDVTIAACEFDGTDRGLRIKTRRGRGGAVARVAMTDVVMRGVHTPLAINAFYYCDPDGKDAWVQDRAPAPVDHTTPRVHDITLTRVTATGVTLAAAAILGLPEAPVTGVRLTDFTVGYDPAARADVPLMADGVTAVRHAGILADFAEVDGTLTTLSEPQEQPAC